jgi:HD-like signal output (HDOD) protein
VPVKIWNFWRKWMRRGRPRTSRVAATPPVAIGTSALALAEPEPDRDAGQDSGPVSGDTGESAAPSAQAGTRPEGENTNPLPEESRRVASSPRRQTLTMWPERQEIAALHEGIEETELARVIGRTAPNAGPEEVLFRYHLSRAIYFGEHDLPPLPHSAARVLELSRSSKAGVIDYARVVEGDPGMVRSVLWLANSSMYASMIKCTSLAQAMVRVGIREVERIALMQAFQARVFRVYGHDDLVRQLGAHGLATALAAQEAARLTGAPPADAFLGGLFHDVGKLVVLGIIAQVQRKLKRRAPLPLIMSAFDAFHEVIGESACRHWAMPPTLVQAVANHDDPGAAARDPLDGAVYLGNLIAHTLASKEPPSEITEPNDPVQTAFGCTVADLLEARSNTTAALKEYQAVFA